MAKSGGSSGIRPITFDNMEHLGVSDDGRTLYWNGKRIEVKRRVFLTGWQLAIALMAGLGSAVSALVAVLEYIKGM